jgi:REP element-mobilizing transposase RayT
MRETRKFYKGGFWHIISRGVAKERIFREKGDFIFYLYKIKEVLKKDPLVIHSYNLIPNHIHHLIEQTTETSPSKFIASLHTSLGLHINKKYSRDGHLFQDRFRAKEIEESARIPVSLYINLNKILHKLQQLNKVKISKREMEKLLEEAERDPWSSYPVYLGLREDGITQTNYILSLISDDIEKARKEYRKLAKHFLTTGYFLKTRDLLFEI